jgi:hypothetical protein
MNITIPIHPSWLDHPAELADYLGMLGRLAEGWSDGRALARAREPGEDPAEPQHRNPPHRDSPLPSGGPTTGRALYGWIKDRKDADTVLKKAQGVAKRLGYSWQLSRLSDDAAQAVFHELTAKVLPAAATWR